MKVLLIPTDRTKGFQIVELPDNGDGRLEAMQKLVGGYIEAVPLPTKEIDLFVNEDGRMRQLPVNPLASILLQSLYPKMPTVSILGDAIVTGGVDRKGETKPIPDYLVKLVEEHHRKT